MLQSALYIVREAVMNDACACTLVQAEVKAPANILDFAKVQFRTKGALRGRNSGDVSDVFSAFLKEVGLTPRTKHEIESTHGNRVVWSNHQGTVFFLAQYDPVLNNRTGYAGECSFYLTSDAPPYASRTALAALSKACTNVANSRGTTDPRSVYTHRMKHGTDAIKKSAEPVYKQIEEKEQTHEEPVEEEQQLSPEAQELWEAIQRGESGRLAKLN